MFMLLIYANSAYLKIENETIKDEHKILIIKDSFANVIVPYLAQVIKRVDVVDIRTSQTDHFNGNIKELIEKMAMTQFCLSIMIFHVTMTGCF